MLKRIFILVFAAMAVSCANDEFGNNCSTPATVRDLTGLDGCGYVFELEDGTRLEPLRLIGFCGTPPLPKEITEDPLYNFHFTDGRKVLISYEVTKAASVCMAGPLVKITCIQDAPAGSSDL